ncbi:hypothetical protein BIV57_17990 [Mangrovactinospora gilvigrisea]|uniref:Uncharacterized protein n=1 Tax=Mangrovactinospora gilvigrisea TaxID=1428644 RepID=A0A1J7BRQ4_9ACTN|nr:hypothetical protein [Mangrovactinospora gilvigrisea]OIV36129.1 hypothetical protein BIV57_17990 [Mangrovactinospora gilvigrisea]
MSRIIAALAALFTGRNVTLYAVESKTGKGTGTYRINGTPADADAMLKPLIKDHKVTTTRATNATVTIASDNGHPLTLTAPAGIDYAEYTKLLRRVGTDGTTVKR